MSNVHHVYNHKDETVHTYKTFDGVDYSELAYDHGLPLLDVDSDDSNRVTAIVEQIKCSSCSGTGKNMPSRTGRNSYWCEFCGGSGIKYHTYPGESGVVERWRSQMTRGGAFNDLYWEPARAATG